MIQITQKYGFQDKTTWISFEYSTLQTIKTLNPSARLGYVVGSVTEKVILQAENLQTGQNQVFIDSYTYTEKEVELCCLANIPLEVWTGKGEAIILNLPPYVNGVTIDLFSSDPIA